MSVDVLILLNIMIGVLNILLNSLSVLQLYNANRNLIDQLDVLRKHAVL